MAAEFDNTSFGIKRRREDAAKLIDARSVITARMTFVLDPDKLRRLESLVAAMDDVLNDLKP